MREVANLDNLGRHEPGRKRWFSDELAAVIGGPIQSTLRIPLDRIQQKLGLSRSAAYRWLRVASVILPISLEDGVVIQEKP
jgi:hypothetical protein